MAMDTSQTGQIIIKDIAERNDFKGEEKRTKKYKAAGKHPTFFSYFFFSNNSMLAYRVVCISHTNQSVVFNSWIRDSVETSCRGLCGICKLAWTLRNKSAPNSRSILPNKSEFLGPL